MGKEWKTNAAITRRPFREIFLPSIQVHTEGRRLDFHTSSGLSDPVFQASINGQDVLLQVCDSLNSLLYQKELLFFLQRVNQNSWPFACVLLIWLRQRERHFKIEICKIRDSWPE